MSEIQLPLSLSPLDVAALVWFILVWGGYNLVIDRVLGRHGGLNSQMNLIREVWMRRMFAREDRVGDAILLGQLIQSVSFFASATMLLVAALVGVLATVGSAYLTFMSLALIVPTPRSVFELKLGLLTAIFVFAFFKFTWAIRQYNYCSAVIGAAPPPDMPEEVRNRLADQAAAVLSLGVTTFNGGLRAYYFALAVLAWLLHPWAFIAMTTWMGAILLIRQFRSRAYDAIRDCGPIMARYGGPPGMDKQAGKQTLS
jgi:uncharacterized membrane protein